jgi:hypothetical protein
MFHNIKKEFPEAGKERGAILVYSILVLSFIITIAFSVTAIFLPKLRIASEPIKSIAALEAADSGLEWCLYINRRNPATTPAPPVLLNGAAVTVYYPASGTAVATCNPSQNLDYRAVGTYQGVARSLEIRQ